MSTNKTFNKVQLDVKFTQATTRANLISEENISISFGKISKYFADLHSQAFTGYTHPTYTAHSSGLYKITVDSKGHVSEATAVAKADITTLGIPGQDTTYSAGNHLTLSGTTFKVADYCKNINGGDWNTVTTNGWYMGAECTNAPSTAWWIGHVHAHNNKYCIQEVWQFTASTDGHKVPHKMRMFVNNVWGNWVDVTVGTQVPENAVFTDTKVTSSANHYTPATASGQDKTASASGATAAWGIDVVKGVTLNTDGKGHVTGISVTSGKIPANPVPSNNVTGSGISGYLVKWNGTNTITNGPQLGSSTTTYLRNDGTWATPTNTDTKVTQSQTTTTNYRPILFGAKDSTDVSTLANTITDQAYTSTKMFAKPETGYLYASGFSTSSYINGTGAQLAQYGLYLRSYKSASLPAGGNYSYADYALRVYDGKSTDNSGMLLTIDGGGLTIVGGGESAKALAALISDDQRDSNTSRTRLNVGGTLNTAFAGNTEQLILSSDNNIYFLTKCNTIADRKPVVLDNDSYFYPGTTGTGSLGTSTYKWNSAYINTIYGTATSANILNRNNTVTATTTGLQYAVGQLTIGSADGNAKEGSNASYKLWSYPAGGTAVSSTFANIQNLRLYWSSSYYRDIFISPNNYDIYHRAVENNNARDWRKILDSGNYTSYALASTTKYAASSSVGGAATSANKLNTNAGTANRPVYFSGGVPVQCDTPLSGSWFKGVPQIGTDGVMKISRYIDFHTTNASTADYDYRIDTTTTAMTLIATGSSNTLTIKSSGNTQLSFQTASSGKAYTASGITCYPLTASGMTTLFNFGGNVVIGGGEAAKTLYDNDYDTIKSSERETLYLASDSEEIHLITGAQTYAGRKVLKILGGQLTKSGGSWISARDNAPVHAYKGGDGTSSSFFPAIFSKSKTGGWAIGTIGNDDNFYVSYTTDAHYSSDTNTSTYTIQFPHDSGTLALTSSNITGTSSNVTGTVAIAHGGTGATNRLAALRALTEQDVGTNAQYFLTITNSWGQGGYTSVANAKTVLGLKSAAYTESSDYVPNTQDGMNAAINLLSTGSSNPGLADYYVSQYANGGTTTKSYHRRPISALWNTFKGLITLTTTGSGNAVTDVSIANDGDHNRKITVTKGSTFSLSTHTHNYAGSSSAGGAATSANKLTTARTITLRNEFQGSASFDGSANITISGSHYRVQCGGQNTTNYPWHRIAYCSGKTGNYSDTDAIIDVWKGYDSGSYGRIKISLRTNNAGAACSASAKWIYRYGFAADDIKIARWGVTGDSVYADVFLKCGQYPRAYIVQIHGNRAWTLVASSEAKDTTSSDKKDSVEVYKTIEAAATELHNQAYTEIKSCEDVAYTRGVAIPRAGSSNDANSFPGKNLVTFTEWPGTSTNNTPTANFYHILRAQGDDTRYGTQLALGMTTNAVYYRNYNNQTWIDWQPLGRFTTTPTSGQVVITDGTTGGIKSSGYTIAKSVPSNAVFTDHITTVTSSGSGNAVTAISADANGALTVTKGSTFSLSTHTHSYAGSSSPGGPANSATRADFVNVVASNEIRFYNDNQFKANNHFWLGYSWAAGSHYTPSGGSDTSSTTAPNITEFVMGNCSQGGLASVHAKTFILGNGSSPTKSSKTTTITTAATTTDRTITLPDDSGTVALTSKTFNVTRGSSVSTATTGFWAAMCNSTQTGSPVLPTSGKWWHVISMDWSGNDIKNWISQLAIATQDGSGVWWRRNDTGGTSINSFSWHRLAEGNSSGAATNIATEVGNSAGARPVFFAYLGDNTRVVYNTNFTYNPSTGTITANKFAGNITSDGLNAGIYELLNTDNPVFNGAEWMLTSIPSSSGGTSEPSFRRVKTAKFADYVNSISRDVLFNDSTNTSKSITLSNPPTDTQYLKLYFKSSGNMGQTTMDNSVYSIAEVPYMTDVNLGGILQVAQPSDNTGVLKSTVLAFTIRITNHTLTLTKAPYPSRLDGSAVANDTHLSANIIKVVAYR